MTFGREPNTFPQSAAHVLNAEPSDSEGDQLMNEMYASAAHYIKLYMTKASNHPTSDGDSNN